MHQQDAVLSIVRLESLGPALKTLMCIQHYLKEPILLISKRKWYKQDTSYLNLVEMAVMFGQAFASLDSCRYTCSKFGREQSYYQDYIFLSTAQPRQYC